MIRLRLEPLISALQDIREREQEYAMLPSDLPEHLSNEEKERLYELLDRLQTATLDLDMEAVSIEAIPYLKDRLERLGYSVQQAGVELRALRELVDSGLSFRLFFGIEKNNSKYFNNPALFGVRVNEVFSEANDDIREAGNCYATANYTATVFHLMRVVGVGLRALAKHQKIKTNVPLELQEWKTLIDGINKTVKDKIENWPKSREKDEALRFFADVTGEIQVYKDELRNPLSHRSIQYREPEARSALNRVQEFMQKLVKYFPEGV
jgi:hypothetical protein